MIQDGLYRVFQQSKPSETRRCDPAEVQLEGTCNIMQLVCEQGPVMVPMVPVLIKLFGHLPFILLCSTTQTGFESVTPKTSEGFLDPSFSEIL